MGVKIFNDQIKLGYLNALFFGQKAPIALGQLLYMMADILTLLDADMFKIHLPKLLVFGFNITMKNFGGVNHLVVDIDNHLQRRLGFCAVIINAIVAMHIKNQPILLGESAPKKLRNQR